MQIEISKGNIVEADTDVIVNAANTDLILGAGVAGAIRRAGGPRIQEECNALAPIALGDVAVTSGGNLSHRYVFHAATMSLSNPQTTKDIVASCTRVALEKAEKLGCKSIAFPALGTGVAGLSLLECADAILRTVHQFAEGRRGRDSSLERVVLVLFDDGAERIFRQKWEELTRG